MMKIKELTPRMGNVEIEAEVAEVGEIREFNKFGKSGRVATARLKDDTGEIEFSLWNEQIDQIGVGDTIKITNGYVKEYQGEMQLTTGMRGGLEIVKKGQKQEKIETVATAEKENAKADEALKAAEKASEVGEERIED